MHSCEFSGDYDYVYKYPGDKLVMHAFLSLDTGVLAIITKTVSPIDSISSEIVTDATVELFENNNFLFSLERIDSMLFASPTDFVPDHNANYFIKVSANELDDITSGFQQIPYQVSIDTILFSGITSSTDITISFQDPPNIQNYYSLSIKGFIENEENYEEENSYFVLPSFLIDVFSDIEFNGNYRSITKTLSTDFSAYDFLIVTLFSLSEELYLFAKTLNDYEGTHGDPLIHRPEPVYTNIINGYGIFGSYSSYSVRINL
jgi:hypothetical protein